MYDFSNLSLIAELVQKFLEKVKVKINIDSLYVVLQL